MLTAPGICACKNSAGERTSIMIPPADFEKNSFAESLVILTKTKITVINGFGPGFNGFNGLQDGPMGF
jgi:hypothetical protein